MPEELLFRCWRSGNCANYQPSGSDEDTLGYDLLLYYIQACGVLCLEAGHDASPPVVLLVPCAIQLWLSSYLSTASVSFLD
jgi:hypothetical protein